MSPTPIISKNPISILYGIMILFSLEMLLIFSKKVATNVILFYLGNYFMETLGIKGLHLKLLVIGFTFLKAFEHAGKVSISLGCQT